MMAKQEDWLAGGKFSRKALLLFESDRPQVSPLLAITSGIAASGAFGLLYNFLGQVALVTTPGARPGLDSTQGLVNEALGLVLGTLGFKALLDGRRESLRRLDSELAFSSLEYVPTDGVSQGGKIASLKRQKRVLLLFGAGEGLEEALRAAGAYRRRWLASETLVVTAADPPPGVAGRWLATAADREAYERCWETFRSLRKEDGAGGAPGDGGAMWLLLGKSGRIRGIGPAPVGGANWDEVLGFIGVRTDLAILDPLAVDPARAVGAGREAALREALAVHDRFYEALKEGNAAAMEPLWADAADLGMVAQEDDPSAARVAWASVLSDSAELLDVVDVDAVFREEQGGEEVVITSIEVVPGGRGLLNDGGPGGKGTLLATKRLRRDAGGQWRILSHQTIPYCSNTLATQSLRCTSRGCLLLKPG